MKIFDMQLPAFGEKANPEKLLQDIESKHTAPASNGVGGGSASNPETKNIIEKWYHKLGFDEGFRNEFYQALESIPISDAVTIENYDIQSNQGKRNLLSILYMCEGLSQRYKERGIPEEILMDTLNDIVIWTNTWSEIKGELYLGSLDWLSHHFNMRLFKVGRLQYYIGKAKQDNQQLGIKKGDDEIGIHIPAAGPLDIDACKASIMQAQEFLATYFPNVKYEYFSCHSWLLDDGLKKILPESSNIIKFGDMFTKVSSDESDAILRYVFGWNVKRYQVKNIVCTSSLAEKLKACVKRGETFHQMLGYIKKQ